MREKAFYTYTGRKKGRACGKTIIPPLMQLGSLGAKLIVSHFLRTTDVGNAQFSEPTFEAFADKRCRNFFRYSGHIYTYE
jgi:hypothetical protein